MRDVLVVLASTPIEVGVVLALIRWRHPKGARCQCTKCSTYRERNGWQ